MKLLIRGVLIICLIAGTVQGSLLEGSRPETQGLRVLSGETEEAFAKAHGYHDWINIALALHWLGDTPKKREALKAFAQSLDEPDSYAGNPRPLQLALAYDAATRSRDFSSAIYSHAVLSIPAISEDSPRVIANKSADLLDLAYLALEKGDKENLKTLLQTAPVLVGKTNGPDSDDGAAQLTYLYQKMGDKKEATSWLESWTDPSAALARGQDRFNRHKKIAQSIEADDWLFQRYSKTRIPPSSAENLKNTLKTEINDIRERGGDYQDDADWGTQALLLDFVEGSSLKDQRGRIEIARPFLDRIENSEIRAQTSDYFAVKQSDPKRGTLILRMLLLSESQTEMYN